MYIDGTFDLTAEDIERTERARQSYTLFDGISGNRGMGGKHASEEALA